MRRIIGTEEAKKRYERYQGMDMRYHSEYRGCDVCRYYDGAQPKALYRVAVGEDVLLVGVSLDLIRSEVKSYLDGDGCSPDPAEVQRSIENARDKVWKYLHTYTGAFRDCHVPVCWSEEVSDCRLSCLRYVLVLESRMSLEEAVAYAHVAPFEGYDGDDPEVAIDTVRQLELAADTIRYATDRLRQASRGEEE